MIPNFKYIRQLLKIKAVNVYSKSSINLGSPINKTYKACYSNAYFKYSTAEYSRILLMRPRKTII